MISFTKFYISKIYSFRKNAIFISLLLGIPLLTACSGSRFFNETTVDHWNNDPEIAFNDIKKHFGKEWEFNHREKKLPPKIGLALSGGGVHFIHFIYHLPILNIKIAAVKFHFISQVCMGKSS